VSGLALRMGNNEALFQVFLKQKTGTASRVGCNDCHCATARLLCRHLHRPLSGVREKSWNKEINISTLGLEISME